MHLPRRRSVGIQCPILPGVMPIMTYGGFKRMTSFCKTAVPQHIADTLEAIKDNEAAVKVRAVHAVRAVVTGWAGLGCRSGWPTSSRG